jgi:cytosol aminopeptidase
MIRNASSWLTSRMRNSASGLLITPTTSRTATTHSNTSLKSFDAIVVGYEEKVGLVGFGVELNSKSGETLGELLRLSGMQGKEGETRMFYALPGIDEFPRVCVVGLGDPSQLDHQRRASFDHVRSAVAAGIRECKKNSALAIAVDRMEEDAPLSVVTEGGELGLYVYDNLKSVPNNEKETPKEKVAFSPLPHLLSSPHQVALATRGSHNGFAQNCARFMMDVPGNLFNPAEFVIHINHLFAGMGNMRVAVRDRSWMEKQQMGALLSVAQGSASDPFLAELHYDGGNNEEPPLILVGKGITFDSGGLNIKLGKNMWEMKGDMGGAAAVVAATYAIALQQLPINVIALVPMCENMPSGSASRPGDVVEARNGLTIEIGNTDAEGRLILADALSYAADFKPSAVIDVATLTGACAVAVGPVTGAFTRDDSMWERLAQSANVTGERFWRLPMFQEYEDFIKSPIADLKNDPDGAGASSAAVFLNHFAPKTCPHLHLDIAGSMMHSKTVGYAVKGMAGPSARTLVEFARSMCRIENA